MFHCLHYKTFRSMAPMPLCHGVTCHLLITRKTGSLLTACCCLFMTIAMVRTLTVFCGMESLTLTIACAAALSLAITVSGALSLAIAGALSLAAAVTIAARTSTVGCCAIALVAGQ